MELSRWTINGRRSFLKKTSLALAGIGLGHKDDEDRLTRGSALFDDLHAYFRRRRE